MIHDCCLFAGPLLLNKLIFFLNDPAAPRSDGLLIVLGLFVANFIMSMCLRQYFWWCFRVGMRLRSAVVTAAFSKSLLLSAGALAKKSTGEITNLMAVDSTRLQSLTPYLHAIWYSFIQIALALYFLYKQVGVSCFGGIAVILMSIPLTGKIAARLKTIQKEMSSVRDRRVKLQNEVLAGMKIIKIQAWEGEFQRRIEAAWEAELALYLRYVMTQAFSTTVYSALPLVVSLTTFTVFVATGHTLDVATALTALALFELLRFPLYMLPNTTNNIIEAKVSVDRVQSFLLEPEKIVVSSGALRTSGVFMDNTTAIFEAIKFKIKNKPTAVASDGGGSSSSGVAISCLVKVKDVMCCSSSSSPPVVAAVLQ